MNVECEGFQKFLNENKENLFEMKEKKQFQELVKGEF